MGYKYLFLNHTLIILAIILMPLVSADLIATPGSEIGLTIVLIFLGNYCINFLLVYIQSKIWLDIKLRKIVIGLIIITPIIMFIEVFILESFFMHITKLFLYSLLVIVVFYFLIGKFYWKADYGKTLVTSLAMGILTNPAWLRLLLF